MLCIGEHMRAEASLSDSCFGENYEVLFVDGQGLQVLPFIQFKKSASCLKINSSDIT